MRNGVIGIVIGIVVGVVVGAAVLAPRLAPETSPSGTRIASQTDVRRPEIIAKSNLVPNQLPEKVVRWKMASAFSASLPQLGTLAKRVDERIWQVSGGGMEIKFHEPGTLVPTPDMFDAVASGAIEATFSSPSMWSDHTPALQIFASVPFGPPAAEFLAWIYFGGGKPLLDEIYHRHGIHGVPCGLIASEASGWFRKEIRILDDLKSVKMRFAGLGARVMEKLGVKTVPLAGGDIFVALETGTIDAAEFSMPAVDVRLGLHEMAKHYYFPGWHQLATMFDLMINLEKWNALSPTHKAQVETVCGDNIRYGLAEGEFLQFGAMKALSAKGVLLHRWPSKILDALENSWRQVATEEAAKDREFKRVWQSLSNFRRNYAIWKELGSL